jgi:predicted ATPase
MAKLIGLSGPQGGGKTTLLNGLKDKGIVIDDFKVSREVQKQLGWESLSQVMKSPETMMQFQAKVRDVKYVRELENIERTDADIILTERTFADIASYTQLWAWELVDSEKWSLKDAVQFLVGYVDLCKANQAVYSGNLILPSMPHVQWQADPHRAEKKHVEFVTAQMDRFFDLVHPRSVPTFSITEESVDGRIEQVYNWIQTL